MKRLALFLLAIPLISGAYILGWTDTFAVTKIVIEESDKEISSEILAKIEADPKVIELGQPIARVDKRKISERLRELPWIDEVSVNRIIFSGEVVIRATARDAIARIESARIESLDIRPDTNLTFLGSNLELFSLPVVSAEKMNRLGGDDWSVLPLVRLGNDSAELKGDVATLLTSLKENGVAIKSLRANNQESMRSIVTYKGRELDISWGNVKDLELKYEVLERLLELRRNKSITEVDLSAPLSPVVR